MKYKFIIKFLIIFLLLQYLILNIDLIGLETTIAQIEGKILGLENFNNVILKEDIAFVIGPNCTGLLNSAILVALVFSFRKPKLDKKIMFLAAGISIILLVNLIRLYLILLAPSEYVSILHTLSWYINSIIVLGLWYWFMKKELKSFNELKE